MNKVCLLISSMIVVSMMHASWVEKTVCSMSLQEKISQLIIPGIRLNCPDSLKQARAFARECNFGGFLFVNVGNGFFQNNRVTEKFTPYEQRAFVQELQALSTYPLLIAQDFEWGLSMRLRECMNFPRALTLGAIQDEDLLYDIAKQIGNQTRMVGVHINFAPVVDVQSNPENPIIHMRSFGQNPEDVARKAVLFMRGLLDAGVIPCAKHFPGHGDTATDSHYDLPVLLHAEKQLHTRELVPFKACINAGIPMVMTAHIYVPSFDMQEGLPASLSSTICTNLLRHDLNFKGIIVTDGLRMRGVASFFTSAHAAVRAFLAGNDILLDPEDPLAAVQGIMDAVKEGIIQEKDITARAEKVLHLKKSVGLHKKRCLDEDYSISYEAYQLKQEAYQAAITLVRDPRTLVPLEHAGRYALITTSNVTQPYEQICKSYCSITTYAPEIHPTSLAEQKVLIPLYGLTNNKENKYGISDQMQQLMHALVESGKELIIILFGTPYALEVLPEAATVVVAYEEDIDAQKAAARCCRGEYKCKGRLPVLNSLQKNI